MYDIIQKHSLKIFFKLNDMLKPNIKLLNLLIKIVCFYSITIYGSVLSKHILLIY